VSEENLNLARRALDAFGTGDSEAFNACCDPRVEIQPAVTRFEGTVFRGASAYREFREQIDEAWESWEADVERLSEVDDDRVMAVCRLRARSRGGSVPIDQRLVWIMTLRDARLSRIDAFSSLDAALEAAERHSD
jgi:ketosteroid isomerase-like protein